MHECSAARLSTLHTHTTIPPIGARFLCVHDFFLVRLMSIVCDQPAGNWVISNAYSSKLIVSCQFHQLNHAEFKMLDASMQFEWVRATARFEYRSCTLCVLHLNRAQHATSKIDQTHCTDVQPPVSIRKLASSETYSIRLPAHSRYLKNIPGIIGEWARGCTS